MGIQKGIIKTSKRYTDEQIIEAARPLGVSEQTYYRWRKEFGGMEVAQVHRLKELEQEPQALTNASQKVHLYRLMYNLT
jgi:transposase-like protein